MKQIFSLIAIITMMLTSQNVNAQVISAEELKTEISKQVTKTYKNYTDADVKATVLTVPYANINLRDGKVTYKVTSNNDRFMARDVKKVEIFVNGSLEKVLMLPVDVKAYKNVLVASTSINRDSALTFGNTIVQRKEVSNILPYVVTNSYLKNDVISKKIFKEGEIIDKRFLTNRPAVARNQEVVAVFKSKGVAISISAIAQGEGNVGDYVLLKSQQYQKVYRGKVIAPNRVLITI